MWTLVLNRVVGPVPKQLCTLRMEFIQTVSFSAHWFDATLQQSSLIDFQVVSHFHLQHHWLWQFKPISVTDDIMWHRWLNKGSSAVWHNIYICNNSIFCPFISAVNKSVKFHLNGMSVGAWHRDGVSLEVKCLPITALQQPNCNIKNNFY